MKTTTRIKQENKDYYSAVIDYAASWLNLNVVDVTIVKSSEIAGLGECSPEGKVLVANGRDRDVVAHTIIHELVHAEQFQDLFLEEIDGVLFFNDEPLRGNAHCIEADRIADILLKEIKEQLS